MAPSITVVRLLKLLCLLAASLCLVPYLLRQHNEPTINSRLAPRAVSVVAMKQKFAPHEGNCSWAQQNLELAPPLPIIDMSRDYILAALNDTKHHAKNNSSNSTARIHQRALDYDYTLDHRTMTSAMLKPLAKRDGAEPCSASDPCPDKSCCSSGGKCGYGPDYCGDGCVSQCDATAMCGRYSEGGNLKCGMNLCCSYYGWCGTDELHCGNPEPNGLAPCQEKFGSCKIYPSPSCGGSSANGRQIGYYQSSNTRDRLCDRVSPSQIDTTGFTHLYFAFAEIDPKTYGVISVNGGDADRYEEFTKLQSSSLETWIAIGGFDFSDPGSTRHTWSDLSSTQGSRAAFITSLQGFMSKYSFQGVDIDWEYPATPERGGMRAE